MFGFICWCTGGASTHYSSDSCSAKYIAIRLNFSFCCGLVRMHSVVVGIQVDGLHALEEFFFACCASVEHTEVVGCL